MPGSRLFRPEEAISDILFDQRELRRGEGALDRGRNICCGCGEMASVGEQVAVVTFTFWRRRDRRPEKGFAEENLALCQAF